MLPPPPCFGVRATRRPSLPRNLAAFPVRITGHCDLKQHISSTVPCFACSLSNKNTREEIHTLIEGVFNAHHTTHAQDESPPVAGL